MTFANEYAITRAAADARRAAVSLLEAIEELESNGCEVKLFNVHPDNFKGNDDHEEIRFMNLCVKITYTKEV